ncbi:unnamed protein product [Haemonchus placei]|uniref:Transmembrane protein n=1 Tax=Haemonchus placei TaxID=6290 RepID=A0A0N4W945_HAEPC|nr:unnamed protein product [Haemonchus placei]
MDNVGKSTKANPIALRLPRWLVVAHLGNFFLLIVLYLHAYITIMSVECELPEVPLKKPDERTKRSAAKRTLPVEVEEYTIIIGDNTLIPVRFRYPEPYFLPSASLKFRILHRFGRLA